MNTGLSWQTETSLVLLCKDFLLENYEGFGFITHLDSVLMPFLSAALLFALRGGSVLYVTLARIDPGLIQISENIINKFGEKI